MNKLDDFLKSKLNDSVIDVPSGWDALSEALPTRKTGRFIAGWAVSILLLIGTTTSLVVFNQMKPGLVSSENNRPATISQNLNVDQTTPSTKTEVLDGNQISLKSIPTYSTTPNKSGVMDIQKVQSPAKQNVKKTEVVKKADSSIPDEVTNTNTAGIPEKKPTQVVTKNENNPSTIINSSDPENQNQTASSPKKVMQRSKVKTLGDFHKGKLYASVSVSLIGSYRSFQLNNGAAPYVNKLYDNIRQNSEEATITNAFSVAMEYRFHKNLSVQGGVSYTKIGFQSKYDFEVTDKATTDPTTGRIIGYENLSTPQQIVSNGKTSIGVIRIPFGINYNLLFNTNSLFHLYVGGSQDFITSASGISLNQLTLQQKSISKTDFVNNAKELCMNLGVNFAIAPRFGLGVDLFYNKWLTDISKNQFENVTPFTGGLNVSLNHKIF